MLIVFTNRCCQPKTYEGQMTSSIHSDCDGVHRGPCVHADRNHSHSTCCHISHSTHSIHSILGPAWHWPEPRPVSVPLGLKPQPLVPSCFKWPAAGLACNFIAGAMASGSLPRHSSLLTHLPNHDTMHYTYQSMYWLSIHLPLKPHLEPQLKQQKRGVTKRNWWI